MTTFLRTVPLEDIQIRSGGDGRTVEAYAAVFNTPVQIADHQGVYREQIAPHAFTKTLNDNGLRFGVFYNHASTVQGTPSERASIPLGTPVEVKVDGRGLYTVSRYNKTPLADEVLESIRNGDITGQSFSGRFIGSDPKVPRGGFKPDARTGELTLVTRTEIALREYGPTPFPAYQAASITGVRSLAELMDSQTLERLLALATRLEDDGPAERTDTPEEGAVTEEPQQHSGRSTIAHLRWMAREKGVL